MLTSTLSHANVLPTYHHEVKRVRVDGDGREVEVEMEAGHRNGAGGYDAQGAGALVGDDGCGSLRLKIYMQYCEGGSLSSMIQSGGLGCPAAHAGRSHRSSLEAPAPQPLPQPAQARPAAPAAVWMDEGAPPALEGATATSEAAGAAEAGEDPTSTSGGGPAGEPAQAQARTAAPARAAAVGSTGLGALLQAPVQAAAPAAGGSGALPKRQQGDAANNLSWEDLERSPGLTNLPYALLAAIDVARGLEYLHGQGVIHGDVNDINVLLKAARPLLPGLGLGLDGGVLSSAGSIRANMSCPRAGASGASLRAPYGPQPVPLAGVVPSAPTSDAAAGDGDPRGLPATPGFGALPTSGAIPPAFDPAASLLASGASGAMALEVAAAEMLGWVFKLADFGLSVQLAGPSQTHVSNLAQGTPHFVAQEVMLSGRLSPAADVYSFGVLLWLLLHGVCTRQVVHLLPRAPYASAAPLLLRHAAPGLPPSAARLLARCLSQEPGDRPPAAQLRQELETVMREVAGPELAQLLLGTERKEVVVAV
ncbi:hypothetical protein HYH03_014525 [Edaphochlamys debaryana]|uniref:Protein kinase domain-containing protein n=1 Tax=Edaphochlamys debaryana TaxID=47281 RepID=A0A835XL64_9CHLO|nr:hypothetical protein HYH03_014525 [Edaphochlamys debaryana]|eukprot:KAG2486842.1 hypothetical protein HYH03_014525 [Edaphochlamys debaryana]